MTEVEKRSQREGNEAYAVKMRAITTWRPITWKTTE